MPIHWYGASRVGYIFGLAGNKVLLRRVTAEAEQVALDRLDAPAQSKLRRYAEFRYGAKTRSTERRVIPTSRRPLKASTAALSPARAVDFLVERFGQAGQVAYETIDSYMIPMGCAKLANLGELSRLVACSSSVLEGEFVHQWELANNGHRPEMTTASLSSRIRDALVSRASRPIVADAGGRWSIRANQLLASSASLSKCLEPYRDRPLVAYLHKSPLYYAFTACAFMNKFDFCPLDINNPPQRVIDIASELPDALIVCDSDGALNEIGDKTENCLKIDLGSTELATDIVLEGRLTERDRDAYYYIATSGSTGRPKLVKVPHDHTIPFIDWAIPFYAIDDTCRWAQFSSIGFDLSLVDFLGVVCGRGCLISFSTELDRLRPARAVALSKTTHWHSVPSMIPYFLLEPRASSAESTCRLFSFCGEPLTKTDAELLAERYPNARIINTYGPTEATLFCSFFEYISGDTSITEASIPIGQPIPSWNFVLYPEDGALRLVIVSNNISEGYVGAHSSLFSRSVLFGHEMRAYDTGDYFRSVGPHLYFSHRKDTMVKVNGNRIDLGEVEAVARRAGLVNPVAVLLGNIIALAAEGEHESATDLIPRLAQFLPRANLPAIIHLVTTHPRSLSGKLDRRKIRDMLEAKHVP